MKQVIVPSFCVDHATLDAGLYLRETRRLSPFASIKVWHLQFSAPRDKQYITQGGLHTIEHIMAYKLRYLLDDKYISFSPFGCATGFEFISKSSLSEKELREALIEVIDHTVPLVEPTEIPSLTEKECGRPTMFNMNNANQWLAQYKAVLLK